MFHFDGPPPKKFPPHIVDAALEMLSRQPHAQAVAPRRALDIPGFGETDTQILDWILGQRHRILARN